MIGNDHVRFGRGPSGAGPTNWHLARRSTSRRLRLHGLIERVESRNCYTLSDDGRRFAVFYSKLGDRVLPALFAADQPNAPPKIRQALKVIDGCIGDYTRDACLAPAA